MIPDADRLLAGRRPTWAEVDLDRLAANLGRIRGRIGAGRGVIAVVKADAYGHGAAAVGPCLEAAGADALAVALPEEGIELRRAGVRCEVLLLEPPAADQVDALFDHRLTPAVTDWAGLDRLEQSAARRNSPLPFHLKVDTGMGRLGVSAADLPGEIERLRRLRYCRIAGVFSHLACAEEPSDPHTRRQRVRFEETLAALHAGGIGVPLAHLANSAAILDHPDCLMQAVRPGILLYGCHPSETGSRMPVEPVLAFHTRVIAVKEVPSGTPIGYGRAFRTRRPSRIATLAVGYHDGLPRSMPPRGAVLVRGRRAPIAGAVSMDLATVDVTEVPGVVPGDPVTLVGRDGGSEIRVEEVAATARTIPYEILCRIGGRVPRLYHRSGVSAGALDRTPAAVPGTPREPRTGRLTPS